MNKRHWLRGLVSSSDNPKWAIENLKLVALAAIAVTFVMCGAVAWAQQPKKILWIGHILLGDPTSDSARFEAIRLALRERGYIEGENIGIVYRYATNRDRLPDLAAELVRLKVDIILASGGIPAIQAAKNATKTIPIIMAGGGGDPVKVGLIESLAHPGGNVTGITTLGGELGGKRLDLLKEAIPKLARVAVLYDPASPSGALELKELLPAARALRLTLQLWEVRSVEDFEKVFAVLSKSRPDGLYVIGGASVMRANRKLIAALALKSRLPSMHGNKEYVDAGGLMSYSADQGESYRRVAYFVDRILKGAKPADLPVEQPMKFELVVNLKTAKQIGVTIDPNLLARANRIIK